MGVVAPGERRKNKEEVTGDWGKHHNEELIDLYCSSNIVRLIKSRRMKWEVEYSFTQSVGRET